MPKLIVLFLKLLKWVAIITLVLVVLLFAGIEIFDRYISTDKGTRWLYSEIPYENWTIDRTASGVRYLTIGDPDKKALVLVHGAPGGAFDWKGFASRADVYDHYRLVIVERPGYGGTKPGGAERSVIDQAARIVEVLDSETKPVTVLGHSYGGPVAVAMGALAPDKIDRVIGVSGQYDPDNEITFPISYFVNFLVFKYILPRWLWVSNVEKLSHPDALRELLALYPKVKAPVLLIHGDKDTLVPYENSPFLQRHLTAESTLFTVEGGDHPLHMTWTNELVDLVIADATEPVILPANEEVD